MKHLLKNTLKSNIILILFFLNVFASSSKEWQKFYKEIESNCNKQILKYFPEKNFSKIGKIETNLQEGYLLIIFFFKTKDNINIGCIYNQKTKELEVNQIL